MKAARQEPRPPERPIAAAWAGAPKVTRREAKLGNQGLGKQRTKTAARGASARRSDRRPADPGAVISVRARHVAMSQTTSDALLEAVAQLRVLFPEWRFG